ncbi:unnamed protein product [Moneuplotes crassus]|uniref:Uncharacterized protein n=1 Tax=Euplotes crassus TaxID=5936 RepID=A0AAD1XB62_EUPCR|nr:unnamed protein product [Moneuplotes crassus]
MIKLIILNMELKFNSMKKIQRLSTPNRPKRIQCTDIRKLALKDLDQNNCMSSRSIKSLKGKTIFLSSKNSSNREESPFSEVESPSTFKHLHGRVKSSFCNKKEEDKLDKRIFKFDGLTDCDRSSSRNGTRLEPISLECTMPKAKISTFSKKKNILNLKSNQSSRNMAKSTSKTHEKDPKASKFIKKKRIIIKKRSKFGELASKQARNDPKLTANFANIDKIETPIEEEKFASKKTINELNIFFQK